MGKVSATYRDDLAMLKPLVSAQAHAQLTQLAEDIQETHERSSTSSEELDRRIAVYMNVREQAVQRGIQSDDLTA